MLREMEAGRVAEHAPASHAPGCGAVPTTPPPCSSMAFSSVDPGVSSTSLRPSTPTPVPSATTAGTTTTTPSTTLSSLPARATPTVASPKKDLRRVSAIFECAQLVCALMQRGVRVLVFCRVRRLVELVLKYVRLTLRRTAPHLVDKAAS